MIKRYTQNHLTWIDLLNPTSDEIRNVIDETGMAPELANDLTSMTPRTESIAVKGTLKMTLDFPIVKRTDIKHPHEVKFIATKNYLVTVRFEDIAAVHQFTKEFEVLSILKKAGKNATGGHLFVTLLGYLYRGLDGKLDYLESRTLDIEGRIFEEREKEMVFEISEMSRRIIVFRQVLAAHQTALEELKKCIVTVFGKTYVHHVDDLESHYVHLIQRLVALTHTIDELRDTNGALLSTKQNEIMKIFTILAFITFPLTLFTSMFGMNTKTTPIVGNDGDFWIIVMIMVIVSVSFFVFFKYKRWI